MQENMVQCLIFSMTSSIAFCHIAQCTLHALQYSLGTAQGISHFTLQTSRYSCVRPGPDQNLARMGKFISQALSPLQFDILNRESALNCTVHCKQCNVQFTMYNVKCILFTIHCALQTVQFTLFTVHCTVYTQLNAQSGYIFNRTVQCTLNNSQSGYIFTQV